MSGDLEGPSHGHDSVEPSTPKQGRSRWRRPFFGVSILLLPLIAAWVAIDYHVTESIDSAIEKTLGLHGDVGDIAWFSGAGLELTDGHYLSSSSSKKPESLRWGAIRSESSWWDFLSEGANALTRHPLHVHGLHLERALDFGVTGHSHELSLPPLDIRDSELEFFSPTQRWQFRIHDLQRASSPSRFPEPLSHIVGSGRIEGSIQLLGGRWSYHSSWSAPREGQAGELQLSIDATDEAGRHVDAPALPSPIPWEFSLERLELRAQVERTRNTEQHASAPNWLGTVELRIVGLRLGDSSISELQLNGVWDHQTFRWQVPPTSLASGEFQAHGEVDLREQRWRSIFATQRTMKVTPELVFVLARISPIFVLSQATPSTVRCNFDLRGQAEGPLGNWHEAIGRLHLRLTDGSVLIPQQARPLAALVMDAELERLPFQGVDTDIRLHRGAFHSEFDWMAHRTQLRVSGYTALDGNLHHDFLLKQLLDANGEPRKALTPFLSLLEADPMRLRGSVLRPDLDLPLIGQSPWLSRSLRTLLHAKDFLRAKRED